MTDRIMFLSGIWIQLGTRANISEGGYRRGGKETHGDPIRNFQETAVGALRGHIDPKSIEYRLEQIDARIKVCEVIAKVTGEALMPICSQVGRETVIRSTQG